MRRSKTFFSLLAGGFHTEAGVCLLDGGEVLRDRCFVGVCFPHKIVVHGRFSLLLLEELVWGSGSCGGDDVLLVTGTTLGVSLAFAGGGEQLKSVPPSQ